MTESVPSSLAEADVVRDVVFVRGPDALGWLQGQVSQDVSTIPVGGSRRSLVLDPRGRVDALVQLVVRDPEEVCCIVPAGHGEALAGRLRRFRLRVRADLELVEGVPGRFEPSAGPAPAGDSGGPEDLVVPEDWPGLEGSWRLWPGRATPGRTRPSAPSGALLERRLSVGLPELGADVKVGMQPHETSLVPWTVSFDKGCFVGQELVARVDARSAAPPRRLVRALIEEGSGSERGHHAGDRDSLALPEDWAPHAGLLLPAGGGEAGHLTESVLPGIALAVVVRRAEAPGTVETAHGATVRLEPLPEPPARR
jgi:folate-binding protein YgfZ